APSSPPGCLAADAVSHASRARPLPLLRVLLPLILVVLMLAMVAMMLLSSQGPPNPLMLIFPVMMLARMAMMFNPHSGSDPDESRSTYLRHLTRLRTEALINAQAHRRHGLPPNPAPIEIQAMDTYTPLREP